MIYIHLLLLSNELSFHSILEHFSLLTKHSQIKKLLILHVQMF